MSVCLRCVLVVLALLASLAAQDVIPLDGRWQLAREPAPSKERVYDLEVDVPATFETALGDAFDGVAWYRRRLELPRDLGDARVHVEFDAAATAASVFCNGKPVGEHLGGWTPFWCDLTEALRRDGTDVLEVRVDEKVGHNTQGFLPVIAPHFGGLWQSVRLRAVRGAAFAPGRFSAFGRLELDGSGSVAARARVHVIGDRADVRLRCAVRDGARILATLEAPIGQDGSVAVEGRIDGVRAWAPGSPHCYGVEWSLWRGGERLDHRRGHVAFRRLEARGRDLLWNGSPLSVRGVLHWGYAPPGLAPSLDEREWRRQLEDFRSLGFNTLKCCLFVPPPFVFDLCDELGLLCWQEYPTWHPKLDLAHRDELLREYEEFHWADGGHASVAFRSITCETGHDADLDVVRALYDQCHAIVRDTLVVDDSSWIGWQRVTDFWDEHPYGNPRWFSRRLVDFEAHQQKVGAKPLLLGECLAADTWVDRSAYAKGDAAPPWSHPECLVDQQRFEEWITREFSAECLAAFAPMALEFGMALRRHEIERLRIALPYAGYVVSVARDVPKARMGLYDDFDRLKWPREAFAWHGERMLALASEQRGFVVKADGRALSAIPCGFRGDVREVEASPVLSPVQMPQRVTVRARLDDVEASFRVWALPTFDDVRPSGVRVVDRLTPELLTEIERGARVLLRCSEAKGSVEAQPLWFLRGAPFAPVHAVHQRLPVEMLVDLAAFDLDGERLVPFAPWLDQVDPVLAFWETHDLAEVRAHLFAFDTRIGEGRLLVSAFATDTDAGRYVEHELLLHLASGPASRRSLRPETVQALYQRVVERTLPLEVWRFRTDAQDEGIAQRWFDPALAVDGEPWRDLRAGKHWENQAEDLRPYTGVAWYRLDVEVPTDWPATGTRLLLEGVDDSVTVFLDGVEIDRRGDPATGTTVWLEPQTIELGERMTPGKHCLCLRVVDHAGAGGLWRPASLTTGPTGVLRRLLR